MNPAFDIWVIPAFMFIAGWLWKWFPPRQRNYWYGYRTRRSMLSDDAWQYANALGAKRMVALSLSLAAAVGIGHYAFAIDRRVLLFLGIAVLLALIPWVEHALKRRFDEQGRRRGEQP